MTPPHAHDRAVLIVEDDPDILDVLAQVLEDNRYHPICAVHGRAALEVLRRGGPTPRLILLDLMMPEMSGVQFRAIQQADPSIAKIPVLLITADPCAENVARTLGAAGWLRKPVRLDALLTAIEGALAPPAPSSLPAP
jgi:CheY-like chemotaxis protein